VSVSDAAIPWVPLTSGPRTVIALPGLDGSRALVNRLLPHLDGEVRLLWADYNRVRGLTYPNAVESLERAVRESTPCAVLAESFGSTLAIRWAIEHPEHAIPLVLSGPLSWVRRRWCTGWGRAAAWVTPDAVRPAVVWVGSQFVIARRPPAVRRDLIRDFCRIPRRAWLDRLAMLLEVDLRGSLADLRAPVTLLWGGEDRVVFGDREAEVFRGAGHGESIRMLPGIGHSIWAENPEAVAEELRRHLNGNGNGVKH
jgi:pimeloyl-ACP methyl ester carboxylesterase